MVRLLQKHLPVGLRAEAMHRPAAMHKQTLLKYGDSNLQTVR